MLRSVRFIVVASVVLGAALVPASVQATPITPINIGIFSYDVLLIAAPDDTLHETRSFSVENKTGGESAIPDFPILDAMTFTELRLILNGTSYDLSGLGPGLLIAEDGAAPFSIQFPESAVFTSAVLTGAIDTSVLSKFRYNDGTDVGFFTPSGTFSATLPLSSNDSLIAALDAVTLTGGEAAAILLDGTFEPDVPTDTQPVPEPATFLLVGSGVVAAFKRRRRSRS